MRYPVNDYETKWYVPQDGGKFGDWRTSGSYFHEALDLNLKTGGDTDLGQPVYSILDGVVEVVHSHTKVPSFGNHVWIKHVTNKGTVWTHSCHMQNVKVKAGQVVKEGTQIGEVGKSGTTVAHLHFAVAKKVLGYDSVAHTKAQLDEYFINPVNFFVDWKDATIPTSPTSQPTMFKFLSKLLNFRSGEKVLEEKRIADGINLDDEGEVDAVVGVLNEYPALKKDKENAVADLKNKNELLDNIQEQLSETLRATKAFLNRVSDKLSIPHPTNREYEYQDVEKEINGLLEKEDQRELLLELWRKVAGNREDFDLQIEVIKNFIQDYQSSISKDELLKTRKERIEELEKENNALRQSKPSYIFQIGQWLFWIVNKNKPTS